MVKELGFTEAQAREALIACKNDTDQATQWLLEGKSSGEAGMDVEEEEGVTGDGVSSAQLYAAVEESCLVPYLEHKFGNDSLGDCFAHAELYLSLFKVVSATPTLQWSAFCVRAFSVGRASSLTLSHLCNHMLLR